TRVHRVSADDEHYRHRNACRPSRLSGRVARRDHQLKRLFKKVGDKRWQLTVVAFCPTILNRNSWTLDTTHFFGAASEGTGMNLRIIRRASAEKSARRYRLRGG